MLMAMCDENSLPVVIDGGIESIDPCKDPYRVYNCSRVAAFVTMTHHPSIMR